MLSNVLLMRSSFTPFFLACVVITSTWFRFDPTWRRIVSKRSCSITLYSARTSSDGSVASVSSISFTIHSAVWFCFSAAPLSCNCFSAISFRSRSWLHTSFTQSCKLKNWGQRSSLR